MTTTRLYVPVAEQIAVSDAIEQAIAADDYEFVRALLRRLPCHESSGARLEMHSCTRRRTRFGVINMIYFVEASYAGRRLEPTTTTTHWFVLRVSNPHCYWHGYKTRNEVRALGFVQQFASTIPTPRLVAYQVVEPHERIEPARHTTPAEVLERIEFLLMERIGGVELEALEPTLTAEQRVRVAESLVRVVSELGAAGERLLERAECRRIGSFTGGETTRHTFPDDEKDDGHQELLVEEMQQQLGRLIVDGPSIGPFESLPDQVRGYAAFLLAAIDSGIEVYERFRTELAPSLRYLLESVLPEYQRQHARHVGGAGGGGALPLRLIHSDLNLGNVLVDPETLELTAVLDWEHARLDVADLEWNNLAGSVSTLLQCESPNDEAVVKLIEGAGFSRPEGMAERAPLLALVNGCQWTVFHCASWWTSLPRQREVLPLEHAEMLAEAAVVKEGSSLVRSLQAIGAWSHHHDDNEEQESAPFFAPNPLFAERFAELNAMFAEHES